MRTGGISSRLRWPSSYRVIAPDFSGMGDSEYRDAYTHAIFDAEVTGLVEALGHRPAARPSATASADGYCSMPACDSRS